MKLILIYFLLFLAGELLNSLVFDAIFSVMELPAIELYGILRMAGSLMMTYLFFWLYTTKKLRLEMKDFGITFNIKKWAVCLSVLLPVSVAAVYMIIGNTAIHPVSVSKIILTVTAALFMAAKSGILEEMLFRGYIMKLLESGWNKPAAILFPSILFGLLHIPAMETFRIASVFLLAVSGTLVGIMFSLAAYKENSVSNSALIHAVWNFVMISDIVHITAASDAYGTPLISVIIPDHILLTGGSFGAEASIIAIMGYCLVCVFLIICKKRNILYQ